jgi:glyoxylase I family protein
MAIRIEGFAPLLQVFDMRTSVGFYRDVLGFEVEEQSSPGEEYDWALLRLGRVELMLNTAYEAGSRPAAPDPERAAGHRDVALFFGCRELDGAYAQLRAQGVEAEAPTVAPYGMKQIWLRDPDGYVLCLQWPVG